MLGTLSRVALAAFVIVPLMVGPANAQGVQPGRVANFSIGTVTRTAPNVYVMAAPNPAVSANTANYRICGYLAANIGNTKTPVPALAVGSAPALPLQMQSPNGVPVPFAGGEFTGQIQSFCAQTDAPTPTAWILDGTGSRVIYNAGAHPVTPAEWNLYTTFVSTAGTNNYALQGSATYSPNGGIIIVNRGNPATVTPSGADTINGAGAANVLPSTVFTMVTLDPASGFVVPVPFRIGGSLSWWPGMNMSAATSGGTMSSAIGSSRVVSAAECSIDVPTGISGSVTVSLFYAPNGVTLSSVGATPISSAPCDANDAGHVTTMSLMSGPVTVPANNRIGAVFTGFNATSVGVGNIQFREKE